MKDEHHGTDLVPAEPEKIEGGPIVPVNMGMLQAKTPVEMMAVAASIAKPLKDFILERKLYVDLGGDTPHVYVEGWTTMLSMLGVMPQEISVKRIDLDDPRCEGWGPMYEAKMALVRISDQQVVCSASAECGGVDERSWHWQTKYKWSDGPNGKRVKTPDGEAPVPGSKRRSMAITRAVGKAARVGFSWVMTLAGYSPTPYEEFDQVDLDSQRDPEDPNEGKPKPAEGKDPREGMGTRGSYKPGGNNPPRQEADAPKPGEVKMLNARFGFECEICGKPGKAGEPIAYKKSNDGTHVAHVDCYNNMMGGKKS